MSTLHILDGTGDTRTEWSATDAETIAFAETQFAEKRAQGYLAYSVPSDGSTGEVLHSFDPSAEAIVLSPPLVGG